VNGCRNERKWRRPLSGGGLPAPRVAQTGSFGSYVFDNVLTGTQYNLFVSAKRFRFTPINRAILLAGDDFTQDFTANPRSEGSFSRKRRTDLGGIEAMYGGFLKAF
jgi:hypothetical protein